MLQVGYTEKFPHVLGFESLDLLFFSVNEQGPCFTAVSLPRANNSLVEVAAGSVALIAVSLLAASIGRSLSSNEETQLRQ